MMITKENYFRTTDGAWIYFEDYDGPGDPIIMLHGFMLSTKIFLNNIDALTEKHRLILVDWRGHGNSSKLPSNLTMERCALDIKELIEHLNLEDVTLFAHSMSASIAMQYYESFGSQHLKRIGILDCYLYPYSYEDWNTHALKGFNNVGMINNIDRLTTDREGYTDGFARSLFPADYPIDEEEIELIKSVARKAPAWIAFPLYNDFLLQDYTVTLPKIDIPLFICGADSVIVKDGIKIAHHYASLANNAYVAEFETEGHLMFYVNPEKFNAAVFDFMENHKAN